MPSCIILEPVEKGKISNSDPIFKNIGILIIMEFLH